MNETMRLTEVLGGDEYDIPACRVQAIQTITVPPNLQRHAVPNSVVLDNEPVLGEGKIGFGDERPR